MTRLLILAHSHPAVSNGGAELAAWRLFEQFRDRPGWEAWFMGCSREPGAGRPGSPISQPFSGREFLYAASGFDWFKFANADPGFPRAFEEVLRAVRPDILHFHHYVNFGMEAFLIARRVLPNARIVLTLHEFQAICHHMGQMVTRPDKALCEAASPRACNRCFPEVGRADFFLRKTWLHRFLALVDQFVSPSAFLAERYIAWGVPPAKMVVIDNVIAEAAPGSCQPRPPDGLLRIGYFGQLTPLKGISVLLAAAALLERDDQTTISFDIHGDYSSQPPEVQAEFRKVLGAAPDSVRFHGPYDNARVDRLMRECDAVLVPSIWWENSPVVIEEALRNRRPVICSDIGGMAEKVRPGRDGLHFRVGSAPALAALLARLAAEPERLAALQPRLRTPLAADEVVRQHLAAYGHKAALSSGTASRRSRSPAR